MTVWEVLAVESNKLRLIMLSGDWIPLNMPERIRENFRDAEAISLGGATEGSIWSIYYPIGEINKDWKSVPYGRPLANQKMYILNSEMQLCPVGVQGEICIGGAGVAQCYMNDAEKTEKAFVRHPELGYIYKTGDYGVLHKEGYIEFLGRKDHQVKIKGYRIELGEIESRLIKHNKVKNAVIADFNNAAGKKYLCAYVVSNEEIAVSELREHLQKDLPEYMLPSCFIFTDQIPLTANGKVDRKRLPQPDEEMGANAEYTAPENEIEEKLVLIWQKALNISKVGTTDNFYDVGGDSLNIGRIAAAIKEEFSYEISLSEIFKLLTIKELALHIEKGRNSRKGTTGIENLVLLREGTNTEKNMFFIHPGSGQVDPYIMFSSMLREDFNYWGIREDKLEEYGSKKIKIQEIAENHIKKIKAYQPKGPYYLSGWSVGGVIAFEMALQLEAEGEMVEYLGMLSSSTPETVLVEKDKWNLLFKYAYDTDTDADMLRKILPYELARMIPDMDKLDKEGIRYYINAFRIYIEIQENYRPEGKLKTQVYFFDANQERVQNREKWDSYCCEPMQVYDIDGNHMSILTMPNVVQNAEIFNRVFQQV